MQLIEKEAAYDYLKVEKEMYELDDEIDRSDQILEELESVLLNFKDHLNEIKLEMTTLQEKSIKMNTSLSNRKQLQKILSSFVDQAVLDPQLIDNICNKEINEQYVDYIRILCQKLEYLKNTQLSDSKSVKDLEPELIKLKHTACKRVREFLIEKLNMLRKPKTNIQILQKNVLLQFKIFNEFLKEHYLDIYVDLCNLYIESMSKIYLTNFKQYVAEISKLTLDIYLRNDIIIPDSAQNFRAYLNLRNVLNLTQQNRSIFQLMNREHTLFNMDEEPIQHTVAMSKNQKVLIEQYFKSVNKLLLDSVISEVIFSAEFFNLKQEQNRLLFSGVFKNTIQFLIDHLKQMVNGIFDLYGLLFIIIINEKNKKMMASKQLFVLDQYFDQINMALWPKFEQVFDTHLQSIQNINVRTYKQLEKQMGFRQFTLRYIDMALSLYKIYSNFEDNKMLGSRIYQLRIRFLDLIKRSSAECENEIERIIYTLSVYEMILSSFNNTQMSNYKKEFNDEILYMEKEINKFSESIVNIYLKEYFGNLVEFIQKYGKVLEDVEPGLFENEEKSKIAQNQQLQNIGTDNHRLIENISQDVSLSWNKRVDAFRLECEKNFQGTNLMKSLLKKFLSTFMSYYNAFYRYAKQYHPSYVVNMTQVTTIMKEIKTIQQKYNM